MLRYVEFTGRRFKKEEDYNVLGELTNNTIILCNNWKIMQTLTDEIIKTVNGEAEYNNYDCDDEDVGNAKTLIRFGLQSIIGIGDQRITLALEPSIIYKANNIEDIWFIDWSGNDEIEEFPPYKESIYPMLVFKGSRKVWEDGKDEVYKTICNGRYGCFNGKWIDLHTDDYTEKSEVTHAGKTNLHLED